MDLHLEAAHLPLRMRFETPLSDEALLRFCEVNDSVWIEREPDGELGVSMLAGGRASLVIVAILRQLCAWAEKNGHGEVFSNAGFLLPDGSMRGAQLALVSSERWQALTEEQRQGFAPLCPEFVVHVLGFAEEVADAQVKMERWMANGAHSVWLFDPVLKQITISRRGEESEVHVNPTSVQGIGLMQGLELLLLRIWK